MSAPQRSRRPIDWSAARERLARSTDALERTFEPDPQLAGEVLRRRAQRLARSVAPPALSGRMQVLVFTLDNERYGIELAEVAEILSNPQCVAVPGAPAALRGVTQLRGDICPVWDLARLLGAGGPDPESAPTVLALRRPSRPAAVAVSTVEGVRSFQFGEFAPAPATVVFVKGITSDLIALLDMERIIKEAVR